MAPGGPATPQVAPATSKRAISVIERLDAFSYTVADAWFERCCSCDMAAILDIFEPTARYTGSDS